MGWKKDFDTQLSLLGHRNWILVVDKAYPVQIGDGVEMIDTGENFIHVVNYVMAAVAGAPHVKPSYYLDEEFNFMSEDLATGFDKVKDYIVTALGDKVCYIPHEKLLVDKIDAASKLYKILVLKTECVIPYTSLFIELGCGYWPDANEAVLREKMKNK